MSVITMPFGKFKAVPIPDLPWDYLRWLMRPNDWRSPRIRAALEAEFKRRQRTYAFPNADDRHNLGFASEDYPIVREFIDRGVKAAVRVHRPGDPEFMHRINVVADKLRLQLFREGV